MTNHRSLFRLPILVLLIATCLAAGACETGSGTLEGEQAETLESTPVSSGDISISQFIREMDYSGREINPPKQLPTFVLKDQQGNSFSSESLLGKAALISFAYTNCPDVCPALFGEYLTLERSIPDELRRNLDLIIISVDPERDTPDRASLVTTEMGGNWTYLVGSRVELEDVWKKFNVRVTKEGDSVGHTGITYLVAPEGTMPVSFPAFATAGHFLQDVSPLLNNISRSSVSIEVTDAWVRAGVDPTAIYLSIENRGDLDVIISGASAEWASELSLHETQMADGLMTMKPFAEVTIPPRGILNFEPGGKHVMVKQLSRRLTNGQLVQFQLQTRDGQLIDVSGEARDE